MTLPVGWSTVTTRIVTDDVAGLAEFMRDVFGATGDTHEGRPTVMRIGDTNLMISAVGPRPPTPAFLYIYVADADVTYSRAILEGGVTTIEPPIDTEYGDRRAMIQDRWGCVWQIATYRG